MSDKDSAVRKRQANRESFSDEETRQEMKSCFHENSYVLDPHGAVALLGLRKALRDMPDARGVFLETAHPSKFLEVVEETLGEKIDIPERLAVLQSKEKNAVQMKNDFTVLKDYLYSKH